MENNEIRKVSHSKLSFSLPNSPKPPSTPNQRFNNISVVPRRSQTASVRRHEDSDLAPASVLIRNRHHQRRHRKGITKLSSSSSSLVEKHRNNEVQQSDDLGDSFSSLYIADNTNSRVTYSGESVLSVLASSIARKEFSNIVVLVGAGLSTGSGIPDFRSPSTGLYSNLKRFNLSDAEDIFDIDFFKQKPQPFYELARTLYPLDGTNGEPGIKPTYGHFFLSLLEKQQILKRVYSQNIDGLERSAGLSADKIVECHGNFRYAHCSLCYAPHDAKEVRASIMNEQIPRCSKSSCQGYIKPDIVFFGENLPTRFERRHIDLMNADLLIIIGTSLQVEPFNGILRLTKRHVPRILFNRDAVGPFVQNKRGRKPFKRNDFMVLGDIDSSLKRLVELIGWNTAMEEHTLSVNNSNKHNRKLLRPPSSKIYPSPVNQITFSSRRNFVQDAVKTIASKVIAGQLPPMITSSPGYRSNPIHSMRLTSKGFHSQSSMYRTHSRLPRQREFLVSRLFDPCNRPLRPPIKSVPRSSSEDSTSSSSSSSSASSSSED